MFSMRVLRPLVEWQHSHAGLIGVMSMQYSIFLGPLLGLRLTGRVDTTFKVQGRTF